MTPSVTNFLERRGAIPRGVGGSQLNGMFRETQGGLIYLGPTRAGDQPPVTDTSAVQLTAVYRSVRIIAATIAMQPLYTYLTTVDADGIERRMRSRLERDAYIWRKPNPEQNRLSFWEQSIGHEVIAGNAFINVEDDPATGLPRYLWNIAPNRVKVGRDKTGSKVYLVDNKIPCRDYADGGEIVHIPGFGYDGLVGYSPIKVAAQAIALGMTAEEYAATTFTQGSQPGGVLSTDQILSRRAANEIRARWDEFHRGARNQHSIAVLDKGAKFTPIALSPEDAQLLETRKYQVVEIARLFGVPPHLVGDVERSTSWGTGIEEQARGFVTFTLQDHIVRFEQALSEDLLGGTDRTAEWDTSALLRGSLLQQMQAYGTAIDKRIMNPNEVRASIGMEPYVDGEKFSPLKTASEAVAVGVAADA